jgi:OmpA-OmpF porin, OOP family
MASPNEEDECPDEPGLPEFNGCPNPDRDGDGIPNEEDECPDEPGPADNAGCPRLVRVEDDQIKILEVIHFATGKAVILEKSFEMLNEVAAVIKAKPAIQVLVEVTRTTSVGKIEI